MVETIGGMTTTTIPLISLPPPAIPGTIAQEPEPISGSHRVTRLENERVVVHDLELFVGYDSKLDEGNERIQKYDDARIAEIIERTGDFMRRGQNPKLILGHNVEDEAAPIKPSIGDIVKVRARSINGAPGIVGDVEMTLGDFETYLRSNNYPRRSAEIFGDGLLSEVALLGSQTPARPLPDTKFARVDFNSIERFSRDVSSETFAEPTETPHGPGPGNVMIPSSIKKRKNEMENEDMKAKLKAQAEEIEDLKAKLKAKHMDDDEKEKNMDDDDEKEKEKNSALAERDQFKRQVDEATKEVETLRTDLTREKFSRKLDALIADGAHVPAERQKEILDRVAAAAKPEDEFDFFSKMIPRGSVGVIFPTEDGAVPNPADSDVTPEEEDRFSLAAQNRALAEGAPEKFATYYDEEKLKAKKTG